MSTLVAERVRVGSVDEVRRRGCTLVSAGGHGVAVFAHEGRFYAVDNRCPHMGFPLSRGTVRDGLLTCHWHHARFDLEGGGTLDPFADDVRTFAVAVDGEDVYVAGYGGQMAAIDARRGGRRWDIDIASTETPWVAGDFIYMLTTRGEVVCLLRDNGRIRWVSPLPRLVNPDDPGSTPIVWSGPILVGDRLLVAGSHGEAITMSPYTGEILGRQELPGPVVTPPVAADDTVYIVTENAQLLAYR